MACKACGLNHPGWVPCKVAARSAVVNMVVNEPQIKPDLVVDKVVNTPVVTAPLVVNKSRSKDRHKKVRREYFRNYMAILRQTPKAISEGRAVALPR